MFLVLIAGIVYFALGIALIVKIYSNMTEEGRSLRARAITVLLIGLVVWAIPYGDHTIGKIHFKILCEKEAGLRIYRTVSNVEGFRSPFASGNTPRQLGYKFVEEMHSNGTTTRFTVLSDNRVIEEQLAAPTSRYIVDRKTSKISTQVTRSEYSIIDGKINEKLAEYIQFGHHGGWLPRQLAAMHAYRAVCPPEPFNLSKLILDVLKPTMQRN